MNSSEDFLHSSCYLWFHENYPELRGLLCYNLNNSRNKIQGMMDKGKGLQRGRSDLVFYYNGKATMIELKTENGTQEPDQKKWQSKIESAGFEYFIIRSLNEFKSVIIFLINTNKEPSKLEALI
jgi:hypothetical protein